jgi:ketosteroid isomerase-like protein
VDDLQDAYRNGSVEGMLQIYTADAIFEDINQRHRFAGTAQLRAMLGGLVGMHLAMDLVETRRVVDGDTVVVEYEYRGQLDGAAMGAAMGKEACPDLEYVLPATSWYEVREGKIVHQKDFIDWATFLDLRQQMQTTGENTTPTDGSR